MGVNAIYAAFKEGEKIRKEQDGMSILQVGGVGGFETVEFWNALVGWRQSIAEKESGTVVGAKILEVETELTKIIKQAHSIGLSDLADEAVDEPCAQHEKQGYYEDGFEDGFEDGLAAADDESVLDLSLTLADTNRDLVQILKTLIIEPAE